MRKGFFHFPESHDGAEVVADLGEAHPGGGARVREEPGVHARGHGQVPQETAVVVASGRDVVQVDAPLLQLLLEVLRLLLLPGPGQELGLVVAQGHDHVAARFARARLQVHHEVEDFEGLRALVDEVAHGDERPLSPRPGVASLGLRVRARDPADLEEMEQAVVCTVDVAEGHDLLARRPVDDGRKARPVTRPGVRSLPRRACFPSLRARGLRGRRRRGRRAAEGGDGDGQAALELDALRVALQHHRRRDGDDESDRERRHHLETDVELVQGPELALVRLRHAVRLLRHLVEEPGTRHALPGALIVAEVPAQHVFVVPDADRSLGVARPPPMRDGRLRLFRAQGADGEQEHRHHEGGVDDDADRDGHALRRRYGPEDVAVRDQGQEQEVQGTEEHEGEAGLVVGGLPELEALLEDLLGRPVGAARGQGLALGGQALQLLAPPARGGSRLPHPSVLALNVPRRPRRRPRGADRGLPKARGGAIDSRPWRSIPTFWRSWPVRCARPRSRS